MGSSRSCLPVGLDTTRGHSPNLGALTLALLPLLLQPFDIRKGVPVDYLAFYTL